MAKKLVSFENGSMKGIGDTDTVLLDGSITLGNADSDNVVFNADVQSNIMPDSALTYSVGSSEKPWNSGYFAETHTNNVVSETGSLQVTPLQTRTLRTLQGTSANTAVLEDTTFTGLGTSSFSVSCWFYAQDTNSNPMSTNTKFRFVATSTERHVLDLSFPDATIKYVNAAGGSSTATYDTNFVLGTWYHIVATFDVANMSTGVPKLWVNGVEVAGTGFTAPGGTTPTINRATIYLDDGTGMHDAVFWSTVLTASNVAELYNNSYYQVPSATSISGNIVSWFKLGEETALNGFSIGNTLSGTITLEDEIGSNQFTLTDETEFTMLGRTIQELTSPGIDVNSSSIKIRNSFTPASATDTGQAGTIAWDSSYIYVCVAQDTWKRVAIGTW
jgi:hypothetical protein